jgi:chromosomal replication initiator protein
MAIEASRVRDWIEAGSLSALTIALDEVTGGSVELALVPLEGAASLSSDPSYSFDSFIASPSNQPALELASQFASDQPRDGTSLFVHGPSGSGKSHLLRAIAAGLDRENRAGEVLLRSAEDLSLELISAIWNGGLAEFRQRLADAGALLIDDVHTLVGRDATQDELFLSLNALTGVPVAFSAPKSAELQNLIEPLRERIRSARSIELTAPEWETRAAIVLDHIQRWQVRAEPKIASFLAGELRTNMQRIDSVLTRLLTHPSCRNGLPRLDDVRQLLDHASQRPVKVVPEDVLSTVARHFNLRQRDLRSTSRSRRVTAPRQIAMYLVRQHCALSYPDIGRCFGRHHTTALHSVRLVKRQLDHSSGLRTVVTLLEKELLQRSKAGE